MIPSACNRVVFVASSHEGLGEAKRVCSILTQCGNDIRPELYTTFFDPSSLTFEALEDMLRQCCGAVFVVRPDNIVKHVGSEEELHMPRANVLLEFGLVAGRLGRRNVAVCRFGQVELPSDLSSLTIIDMDCSGTVISDCVQTDEIASGSLEKLKRWTSHLMATAERIPRTAIFHGYTGRWEFEFELSKWRGAALVEPEYAIMNGSLDLLVSCPSHFVTN